LRPDLYGNIDQFMGMIGFIAAALSLNCSECHDSSTAVFASDNPEKQMASRAIVAVNALNKANFGGRRAVTSYWCHSGDTLGKSSVYLRRAVCRDCANLHLGA
jgi:hypothetical protein